jgi:hypothetical protein
MKRVMAHLRLLGDREWGVVSLDTEAFVLDRLGPRRADHVLDHDPAPDVVALRRCSEGTGDTWALVAGPKADVLVNGMAIPHGIAVLADRDEIRLPLVPPMYFSTETLARVAAYPDEGAPGFCPRCKQRMTAGDAAVRCPNCGLWHHSTEELPCWTYGNHCASCPQPTALDAGFRWTPEDL